MDLLEDVADYLEANLTLFSTIKIDSMPADDNVICLRGIPSSPTVRFMDKSKDEVISFQILARHKNQKTAKDTVVSIASKLDGAKIIPTGNYQFLKCESYTLPSIVDMSDRGGYIYSAMFQILIND